METTDIYAAIRERLDRLEQNWLHKDAEQLVEEAYTGDVSVTGEATEAL